MVSESDIQVYDAADWVLLVDGVPIESPLKFEMKPTYTEDDAVIKSLYGPVGFEESRLNTTGEGNVTTTFNSDSRTYLDGIASSRKKVPVEAVCVANLDRYPVKRKALTFARIRPAAHSVDKQAQGAQYDLFGFGWAEA